jgi:AraC-like DNA-binding protein
MVNRLDYVRDICSLAVEIEKNIKKSVDYDVLETLVGYSYHHIRDFFKENTNTTLSRYILARKIANAAFEICYSNKSITDIAFEYEFSNLDTFTRAFQRYTGFTPSLFKKSNCLCGRRIIAPGVYAPVILNLDNSTFTLQHFREVNEMGEIKKTVDSCILYGVPDIRETTKNGVKMDLPFPNCLQVVLNYMGQDISYNHIMAATGLAFSQRWGINGWNEAAIDSRTLYETPFKPFELAFKGAGRKFEISVSDEQKDCKAITKEEALKLIKVELDCGRPLIALGVVGPPEPCLITGYRNNGETVLGWSLFQDDDWLKDAGFPAPDGVDESGYFIKNNWWGGTQTVMSIGEEVGTPTSVQDILQNALNIIIQCKTGAYYGGEF